MLHSAVFVERISRAPAVPSLSRIPVPSPLSSNSYGIISFADPHHLNSVASYRYKNIGGWVTSNLLSLSLLFHLPYTPPSSVSRKSCSCRSYENCRGVHQQFPFWISELHAPQVNPYSPSAVPSLSKDPDPVRNRQPPRISLLLYILTLLLLSFSHEREL